MAHRRVVVVVVYSSEKAAFRAASAFYPIRIGRNLSNAIWVHPPVPLETQERGSKLPQLLRLN